MTKVNIKKGEYIEAHGSRWIIFCVSKMEACQEVEIWQEQKAESSQQ